MPPEPMEVIVRVLSVELDVPVAAVRDAASLRRDLGMDSIAAANVFFSLEDEFGVEIWLEDGERIDCLAEIEAVVERFLPPAGV